MKSRLLCLVVSGHLVLGAAPTLSATCPYVPSSMSEVPAISGSNQGHDVCSACHGGGVPPGEDHLAWAQISHGGMVQKDPDGKVSVDTGIWVFNPNTKKNLKARIVVYDKYGTQVATSLLYDGGAPALIPPMGYGWITLGMLVGPCEAQKFRFSLNFTEGNVVQVAPTVEIKEVIYDQPVLPDQIHNPQAIKCWSETSLGGPNGTGFRWQ